MWPMFLDLSHKHYLFLPESTHRNWDNCPHPATKVITWLFASQSTESSASPLTLTGSLYFIGFLILHIIKLILDVTHVTWSYSGYKNSTDSLFKKYMNLLFGLYLVRLSMPRSFQMEILLPCPASWLYLEFNRLLLFIWGTGKSVGWSRTLHGTLGSFSSVVFGL